MYDNITIDRIKLMHPSVRVQLERDYLEINKRLPKGVRLRFSQTLRTVAEQDALYAQGRTKAGKKVTNAKGGQSIHNYGLAFDIVILLDKDNNGTFETASFSVDKYWMIVVDFFKAKGWTWGGDFKSLYDAPHFEYTKGKSWQYYSKLTTKRDTNGQTYIVL